MSTPVWMMGGGGLAVVLGIWIWWRAGRHDITGQVVDAAWHTVKTRGDRVNVSELETKVRAIQAEESNLERAKMVGRHVARHFVAKVVGWFGLAVALGGSVAAALGYSWR